MPGTQAPPLVLSIQSHVAYGHVGNDAAMLPLQLLGIEPVAVHTVQFSNHTGYGEYKGQVFTPAHVQDVLDGLRARGVLARCTAVLSGYLGDAGVGEAILAAVQEVRAAQPGAHYLCDPVMGDVGRGLFVRPGIPDFLRKRALSQASVITPNHYEFELLCGGPLTTVQAATQAARTMLAQMHDSQSALIVITSLRTDDLPADQLATLAVTADKSWLVQTPYIDLHPLPNGMGDVFSAVLLGHLIQGRTVADAVSRAVSTLYALVSRTESGQRDLPLVASRDQITAAAQIFAAVPVMR
ncbi:pyridoxal kinase PdxY [Comamonas testosteroni]|uniref:pyridoxal kinase n=1 Tax=Comamonas testosteroni (strain DSM 14576 / KF-1) TaxID=399795 RepID=B7X5T7_COMTK|nr:pyridoxal kinase PdxY [Comamonas testosteroni]EED68899.1 pyridoxal kinase [Comamonas testosteroni KF-1]WQG66893.1 pyridoxal kinase PdxY [Comamonas testosteroni]